MTKAIKKDRYKVTAKVTFKENARLEIMADNTGKRGVKLGRCNNILSNRFHGAGDSERVCVAHSKGVLFIVLWLRRRTVHNMFVAYRCPAEKRIAATGVDDFGLG